MTTGFQIINQTLWIDKDPQAQLTYTFDWSEWLDPGDTIATSAYSLQVRANDPEPLVNVEDGVTNDTSTYITLNGGQVDKNYVVTCQISTIGGLIDRRSFRVKVINRSA
jgi:hypothetical protein